MIRGIAVLLALAAPAGAQAPATPAPAHRPGRVLPGEDAELKTKDGWTLAARYLASKEGRLTLILVHGTGGRKEEWYSFCKAAEQRGLGYIALDLRGHGASRGAPAGQPDNWRKFPPPSRAHNEWNDMLLDVDAAGDFLEAKGVAPETIAAGGADVGSTLALKYAALHQRSPLVFLLSPGMSYKEVQTMTAIRAYGHRPILLVVGADDNRSVRETAVLKRFADAFAGADDTTLITAEREHGTKMLSADKGLIAQILDWVESPRGAPAATSSTPTAPGTAGEPAGEPNPAAEPTPTP